MEGSLPQEGGRSKKQSCPIHNYPEINPDSNAKGA